MRDGGRLAALLSAAVLLAGCEEVWNSVYREGKLGVVTDAKQRVIVRAEADGNKDSKIGHNEPPNFIICAEPSPDVAQAISSALQASLNVESKGTTVGAGFGFASSAAVAQLGERLATIQLLRDKMYRACEAYANGAINASGYTLMLARLDKTMVTLLTNEMAAGAFGRALAQISGSAATGPSSKDLAEAAEDVRKKSAALQQAAKDKKPDAEIEAARKSLDDATQKLAALELLGTRAQAAAATANVAFGQISGRNTVTSTGSMFEAIHRNYLDDDGLEALVDACITSVEHVAIQFLNNKDLTNLEIAIRGIRVQQAIVAESFDKARNPPPSQGEQRDALEAEARQQQDALEKLYGGLRLRFAGLARYGFADLCLTEILRGKSEYVDKRLQHEINLRTAARAEQEVAVNVEKAVMCRTAIADPTKLPEAQKGEILKACATFIAQPQR